MSHLFEEIAGKGENVEEGGISERRGNLPMFCQGMRRVRLLGRGEGGGGWEKKACWVNKIKLGGQTDVEGEDAATAYLVNLIGQLGEDGDPDDAVLHTVLLTNPGHINDTVAPVRREALPAPAPLRQH